MSDQYERDGNFYDDSEEDGCDTCWGQGWVVVCPDDICRGAGECMHGDGEIPCPNPRCDAL